MARSWRKERQRKAQPIRRWLKKRTEDALKMGKATAVMVSESGMTPEQREQAISDAMAQVCAQWMSKLTRDQRQLLNDLYLAKKFTWAEIFVWHPHAWQQRPRYAPISIPLRGMSPALFDAGSELKLSNFRITED